MTIINRLDVSATNVTVIYSCTTNTVAYITDAN